MDFEPTDLLDDNQETPQQRQSGDSPYMDTIPEPVRVEAPRCSPRPKSSSTTFSQPPINTDIQDHLVQEEPSPSLYPLTIGLARVSIDISGQDQHGHTSNNDVDLHRQLIKTLSERVAFLEQKKIRQVSNRRPHSQHGLPTPEVPSAISSQSPIDTASQSKDHHSSDDLNWYKLENQTLREKLGALEQENKALEQEKMELTESHLQSQPKDQFLIDACPAMTATKSISTLTSTAVYDTSHSGSIVRARDDLNNNMGHDEESTVLEQEIQSLRAQLAVKKQEKDARVDYTLASIELAEFLDGKMEQMEQSMHGLWNMMASNEAARFSMRSSSAALGRFQQQLYPHHQKSQQQQEQHDRHHLLKLRVDALRRRIGSHGYLCS
jgi:hypothetical protein